MHNVPYPHPEYKAYTGFEIFEKYSISKKDYLPTRYGNKGDFVDTDRIITDYKDIEKQMTKISKEYQKRNNRRFPEFCVNCHSQI